MAIDVVRVDERMLHGQVMASYAKYLSLDEFIVVNDIVAKDEDQKMLLEIVLPTGAEMDVVSCKTFAKIVEEDDFWGEHTCVVFRYIEDAIKCLKMGCKMDKMIIGGMQANPKRPSKVKYAVSLFVDEQDKTYFKELEDAGVELVYQLSYFDKEQPLNKVVKY